GMLKERGGELVLAQAPRSMGLVKREGSRHERLVPYHARTRLRTFANIERALEYAEDKLLLHLGESGVREDRTVRLEDSALLQDFDEQQRITIAAYFHIRKIKRKKYLFRIGDQGDELFVILRGQVEILLPYSSKKRLILAKFGPGMTVGEVAFLEPGSRTADGRVTEDCTVAILGQKAFNQMCEQHPDQSIQLLLKLGRDLGENLRRTNEGLRRLVS
ncbi:MAG: cyclic nucleotide-binding domain-containing protein, partial [Mariprofundaceae bacterium]|nr:cyclic nucleotide-binding domain-containing protein [Mariprofundaceae bacterium]